MNDRDRIREIEKRYRAMIFKLQEKICELELERDQLILNIERACDHEDDGAPFIGSCKKCGALLE